MGIEVRVNTIEPRLRALVTRLRDQGQGGDFALRWAVRVRLEAMKRAIGKGGRRFWRDLARSIFAERDGGSAAVVGASHPAAAQKQYGGRIHAKGKSGGGADVLTIPLDSAPEARGRRAKEFSLSGLKLFALGMEDGRGVLGYTDKDGEFKALYALVRQTKRQTADPFMPSESEISDYGLDEAQRLIERNA
jgi:hypothetical protein